MSTKEKSKKDTKDHKKKVSQILLGVAWEIRSRARQHDASKLEEPELSTFAECGPKLKELKYGSESYAAALSKMGGALKHHYEHNRHHPEHFEGGIKDMNIIDLIEMLCDWKAASLRMSDGDFLKSVKFNKTRFSMSDELTNIFENTADLLDKFSK